MSPLRSAPRKPSLYSAAACLLVATAASLAAQQPVAESAPTSRAVVETPASRPAAPETRPPEKPLAAPDTAPATRAVEPGAVTPPPPPPVAVVDAAGRFVVRGKPVFINGWYSDGDPGRLRRLAAGGFNAVLDYGLTARPVEATRAYLAEAAKLGVMVIAAVHDVYPSATHRTELGSWRGNEQILAGLLPILRESPAVVAYYVHDELPAERLPEMEAFSRRVRELDPTRPLLLVHETPALVGAFAGTADLFGIDHYPVPQAGPGAFAGVFDAARAALGPRRPLWGVLQNFAWYQHRDPVPPLIAGDQPTERARLPHPDEWRANRPPTRDETRCMHYVALARGAQGLLWWCLYNADYLPDRAERWEDAVRLAAETDALSPYLLGEDGAAVTWSDPRVLARVKRLPDGRRILIAVNTAAEPVRVSAVVDPAAQEAARVRAAALEQAAAAESAARAAASRATESASRPSSRPESAPTPAPPPPPVPKAPAPRTIDVLFESRLVRVEAGVLVDFFAPYDRHVYRLDP